MISLPPSIMKHGQRVACATRIELLTSETCENYSQQWYREIHLTMTVRDARRTQIHTSPRELFYAFT